MKVSLLNKILQETGLSPEQLSGSMGVSNMTLRRWSKVNGSKKLSEASLRIVMEGLYRLLAEGTLNPDSPTVKEALIGSHSHSFEAVLAGMGVTLEEGENEANHQERMTTALFQIGANKKHQAEVHKGAARLRWFQKLGANWKDQIQILLKILKLKEVSFLDKTVAYGALFYLISPMDLIPDSIPVFGLVDDYAFLVLAIAFYTTRFPHLVGRAALPGKDSRELAQN